MGGCKKEDEEDTEEGSCVSEGALGRGESKEEGEEEVSWVSEGALGRGESREEGEEEGEEERGGASEDEDRGVRGGG